MSCACRDPAASAAQPQDSDDAGCSGGESFALRVLGDEMAPEFNHGDILIIEPDGALQDGRFVLAQWQGEWLFRQLRRQGTGWVLHALQADANPARGDLPDLPLVDLSAIRGVVIQKAVPGRRRLSRFYV